MDRGYASLKEFLPRLGVDGTYRFPLAEHAYERFAPFNEAVDLDLIQGVQNQVFSELDEIVRRLGSYLDANAGSFGGIRYSALTFDGMDGGSCNLLLPTVYLLEDAGERDWRLYWLKFAFHPDFVLEREYGNFGEKTLIGWHTQVIKKENVLQTLLSSSK